MFYPELFMRKTYLLTLVLSGIAFATAIAVPEDSRKLDMEFTLHKGLVYSSVTEKLTMDLIIPQGAAKAAPCVIVIQGGGFKSQDGQRFRPFAEHLAKNGFAAVLIAYRGRPDHTYQETISDIKAAVRFVREISGEYGISSDRIGAMGRSAGATLAALLAVTGDIEEFDGDGGHAEFSSRIQAAVGISGVYDFVARFTNEEEKSLQPGLDTKIKTNGEWIGTPFSPTSKHWINASAINHVDAADPPMLLLHSKNDQTVPWLQSKDMHKKMIEVGIRSEFDVSKTGRHGGPANTKDLMVTFFKKVLVE
jgi:acetyl esterase/lipase